MGGGGGGGYGSGGRKGAGVTRRRTGTHRVIFYRYWFSYDKILPVFDNKHESSTRRNWRFSVNVLSVSYTLIVLFAQFLVC